MNLIVIDTETSDLDPSKGAVLLELAWINVTQTEIGWRPTTFKEVYIEYEGPISPHAHAVHHINPARLLAANGAVPRITVLADLVKHLEPETYFVAHNVEFDSKFLPELTAPWICTYRCARHLWPTAPGHSNQVLRYWLGIEPSLEFTKDRYPHQAIYDAATTAGLLLKMLEMRSPLELLRLSEAPIRLKAMPFGKHKGVEFGQIPRDYLDWLSGRPDLDVDLRHTIDSFRHG